MANLPGSNSLGRARGEIDINLSPLQGVTQRVRTISAEIGRNLEGGIAGGARRVTTAMGRMTRDVGRGLESLGNRLTSLQGLFAVGLAVGAARAVVQLTKLRNESIRAGLAFEILSGSAGAAEARIRAVVAASGNAITSMDAIAIGTQAAALNLARTSEELEKLTRAARAVTIVSPVINDMSTAISELGLASANLSFRRLDQLGLSVSEVRERMEELRRTNAGLDESQLFLQATVGLLNEKYADLLDNQKLAASGLQRLGVQIRESVRATSEATGGIDSWAGAIANYIQKARTLDQANRLLEAGFDGLSPAQAEVLRQIAALRTETNSFITITREENEQLQQLVKNFFAVAEAAQNAADAIDNVGPGVRALIQYQRFIAGDTSAAPPAVRQRLAPADPMFADPGTGTPIGEVMAERREQVRDLSEKIIDAERDAARDRAEAIADFARQRAETIESFERQQARDLEDFARQRRRDEEDLNRQIAEIQEDRAEMEADARRRLHERIEDIEEDFARQMGRAQRDHRDNLLDAAARGDARAIFEEQRRFRRQQEDLRADREERITQEQENAAEQMQLQQEAAAERIQALREDFERRKQMEDEDRAIRLQRAAEDHTRQLRLQQEAHNRRLFDLAAYHQEAIAEQQRFLGASLSIWREAVTRASEAATVPAMATNTVNTRSTSINTSFSITGGPGSTAGQIANEVDRRMMQILHGIGAE